MFFNCFRELLTLLYVKINDQNIKTTEGFLTFSQSLDKFAAFIQGKLPV